MKKRIDFSSPKQREKISARIRSAYLKQTGSDEGVEDAIQEVFSRFLSGKRDHATINQVLIDYLRTKSGRKDNPDYELRRVLEYAITFGAPDVSIFNVQGSEDDPSPLIDFKKVLNLIPDKKDRCLFGLYYRWGLSTEEIGELFGVNPSGISMRLRNASKKLLLDFSAETKGSS